MQTQIILRRGDLFKALKKEIESDTHNREPILVAHCCNNIGAWGKGFVLALSQFDTRPETLYRATVGDARQALASAGIYEARHVLGLGSYSITPLKSSQNLWTVAVANVIGQHDIFAQKGVPPIRYCALLEGINGALSEFEQHCLQAGNQATNESGKDIRLWVPRLGSGLAGGEPDVIECLLRAAQGDARTRGAQVEVTIFEL